MVIVELGDLRASDSLLIGEEYSSSRAPMVEDDENTIKPLALGQVGDQIHHNLSKGWYTI